MKNTVKVYSESEKAIGWFMFEDVKRPKLILFAGEVYQLHPRYGPIQNDCYISLGKPIIKSMIATEIDGHKL